MDIKTNHVSICDNRDEFSMEYDSSSYPIIHLTGHQKKIYPWLQDNLNTPFWRCYWNVTPGGWLRVGGAELELKSDQVYIIPGYFRFSTFAREPFEQFYIHFSVPDNHFPADCGILTTPIRPHWKQLWREWEALEKSGEKNRFRRETAAGAILGEALLQLPREVMTEQTRRSPMTRQAMTLIRRNLSTPRSNPELARACGVDLRTFLRHFLRDTGESPQQFSRRIRIEAACRYLLYTTKSIEEIAELTGFADRYYFSRVFRRLQQKSPARFRRQQQPPELADEE